MTGTAKRYELDQADVERAWACHVAASAGEGWLRHKSKRETARQFLASLGTIETPSGQRLVVDQPAILRWMVDTARRTAVGTAVGRLAVFGRFLEVLSRSGLVDTDLLAEYRTDDSKLNWSCLAQALRSADPEKALAALRPVPPPPGPLAAQIAPYLDLQRSLGKKYAGHGSVLRDLDQFLHAQAVAALAVVTPTLVEGWLATMTCIAAVRIRKARAAKRFFDHLLSLGLVARNPVVPWLHGIGRGPDTSARPFIFTQEQVAAILAEARRLPATPMFRLRAETCSTMLTLLYALGLRHGEVRRLRVRDLDFKRQALFIDRTKFHKSRYVPFGPKVSRCLEEFLQARRLILMPLRDDDPLFVTCWRVPIAQMTLGAVFRAILRAVRIQNPAGRPPRVHDLRHAFAVHRLLRWYRAGVDVQSRLPWLSTFMGHVEMRSTEVYLTVTQELLQEANTRFHQHFGRLFDEEERR